MYFSPPDLQIVTKSPAEIPRLREVSTRQGRHLCLQLHGPAGVGVTAIQYISRTNQLAVGFFDGYLQLWNMKSLKKEWVHFLWWKTSVTLIFPIVWVKSKLVVDSLNQYRLILHLLSSVYYFQIALLFLMSGLIYIRETYNFVLVASKAAAQFFFVYL